MAEDLKALVKERDELLAQQPKDDGFAGAAPGNNRPRTPAEKEAAAADIKAQIEALKQRDRIVAEQRVAAAKGV